MRARRHTASQAESDFDDPHDSDGDEDAGRSSLPSQTVLLGLLLYTISTVFGASTSIIVKLLGGSGGVPAMQLVLVRSCVLIVCSAPTLRHPAARKLIAERHDLLAIRGCLGFVSVAFMYIAVRLLPLSDAVSLAFLAPLLVAALSPLLLHERPPRSVLFALLLAAVGALLVARPASLAALLLGGSGSAAGAGISPSKAGVAAALAHAASAAGARLAVRSLGIHSTHHSITGAIVLAAGAVSALGSGAVVAAQRSWVSPSTPAQWLLLSSVGLVGMLHQATMTAGLQRVPVSTTSSLTYLSIIWSMLADFLIFRQLPAPSSMLGAALICAGGLLLTAWRMHSGFDASAAAAKAAGGGLGKEGQPGAPLRT
ncbi:hypothetical protein ABPG75_006321 [Micractinium tetrahymenae]